MQHEWAVDIHGSRIQVRTLGPDDYDAIVLLSLFLSDRDRYLRFFTTHPNHLDEWARSLTAVDDRTRVAILRILGNVARTNGFHHVTADVLAENTSMCKVISDAG